MSSDTYQSQVADIWTGICIYLASVVIMYYDHLITFGREVLFVWSRPGSLSSVLFLLNRYFAFFSNIALIILISLDYDPKRCQAFNVFEQVHRFLTETLICAIMMLRIYALYSRDRRIIYLFILCSLVIPPVCIWALTGQKALVRLVNPIIGCARAQSEKTDAHISASWLSVLAYDTLMTLLAFWQAYRSGSYKTRDKKPLPWLIARDGILYFIVIGLVNTANIILLHVGRPFIRNVLSTPTVNVSAVLTSRLLLNLSEHSEVGIQPGKLDHAPKVHRRTSYTLGTERTGNIHLTELYEMMDPEGPRRV